MNLPEAIFVPQGSEYQAVKRGLRQAGVHLPLYALPIGIKPTQKFVKTWLESKTSSKVRSLLLTGLCGSLTPQYTVGNVVLCDRVQNFPCDSHLTAILAERLHSHGCARVNGYTSESFLATAQAKQQYGQQYHADIVDMEGIAVLEQLQPTEIAVAILRVVSDDAIHDLPDLNNTIDSEGRIQARSLALAFLRQPSQALRLIQGARQGLKVLQKVINCLYRDLDSF
ncbi:MAG: hypothetical protein SAJ12_01035 [Jaaginema sp. PMC 1079.18]|nr:hypothetical protein [Jaaginema sp. PMC 1080.18]MEC4849569.1 hypothetical protein [Jaaginema sp. PMC 1079.18]MEC4866572.1 hypothetical protein [Jaaginema sp. PMC 1078.18]